MGWGHLEKLYSSRCDQEDSDPTPCHSQTGAWALSQEGPVAGFSFPISSRLVAEILQLFWRGQTFYLEQKVEKSGALHTHSKGTARNS
jgi:hypothetical protein